MTNVLEKIAYWICIAVVLFVSVLMGLDVANMTDVSDMQILMSTPEDLLGFGFWPTWILTTCFVVFTLLISAKLSRNLYAKGVVVVCVLIYLSMSFVWYSGFTELEARVFNG